MRFWLEKLTCGVRGAEFKILIEPGQNSEQNLSELELEEINLRWPLFVMKELQQSNLCVIRYSFFVLNISWNKTLFWLFQ